MLSLMHHLCSEKFNTLDTVHSLGGSGVLTYTSHIGLWRTKVIVFAPFRPENGYGFWPFWSGMAFAGTAEVYERIFVSIPNE